MDEWAVPVKIEPEDDLEYLQREVNLAIKTEIDIPIKSEFDEGLQCYQQQRGQQPLMPFPSIKEELHKSNLTETDLKVKSEKVCKEDDKLYQQQGFGPVPLTFPPIKDEFNTPVANVTEGGRIEGKEGWRTLQTRGEERFETHIEHLAPSRSSAKAETEHFYPSSLLAEHVVEPRCRQARTRLQSVRCIWRERRSPVKLVPRVDSVGCPSWRVLLPCKSLHRCPSWLSELVSVVTMWTCLSNCDITITGTKEMLVE
uniref:Uncharacterized protein n=1 Tax=Timema cristinae TaxID=61476 RepID=A0A7R9DFE1_TIMCR|nr:unnamed protein product [Timema cristinae]